MVSTVLMQQADEAERCAREAQPAMTLTCDRGIEHDTAVLSLIKTAVLRIFQQVDKFLAGGHARHLHTAASWLTSRQLETA